MGINLLLLPSPSNLSCNYSIYRFKRGAVVRAGLKTRHKQHNNGAITMAIETKNVALNLAALPSELDESLW